MNAENWLNNLENTLNPVRFGKTLKPRRKNPTMGLASSKFAKSLPKPRNQWREYTISEGNVTDLISSFLESINCIPNANDVDKVIVGDLTNGQYVMAVAFKKGKEV